MDLVPLTEEARDQLAASLYNPEVDELTNKKRSVYIARTFPSILLDITRYLTEQSTKSARENPSTAIQQQLKPFLMFAQFLGKSPQINGLMYSYFENSSFQPLPENLFQPNVRDGKKIAEYLVPGFSDELLKEILLNYFKYITYNRKWFSAVWNWSELGRLIAIHTNDDIRYLASCCLSAITNPSRVEHINSLRDLMKKEPYHTLIDLQIKYRHMFANTFRPCIGTNREMQMQFANTFGGSSSSYNYCVDSLAKVANVLLVKRELSLSEAAKREFTALRSRTIESYTPIKTVEDTISQIAYSISINRPCIIRGQCGSGKTAILDYIAAQTNRLNPPDYIKVQIGDQIDSKLLIGTYVCTEIPGQFEWQPGPLTKAMLYGSWIVFEDIDSAPSEMAQVIHSVIENGNLSCVSCCPIKLDSPHPDFRIFFTQRTRPHSAIDSLKIGFGFVERLCDIVDIPELSDPDLMQVIETKYKFSPHLSKTILQLFLTSQDTIKGCNIFRATRSLNLRDLFKLCERIKFNLRNITIQTDKFSSSDLDAILLDAADCLHASLPISHFKNAAEKLGQVLSKAGNIVQDLVISRQPEVRIEGETMIIGRARLHRCKETPTVTMRSRSTLGYTKPACQLMERVSLCIKFREPVLLVGETGVGKTSIVQHIASTMSSDLVVINLSQQSDSSDLLGGYKPVDMKEVMKTIHIQFENLFRRTFDAGQNATFLKNVETRFVSAKSYHSWRDYVKIISHLCSRALGKELTQDLSRSWNELHVKTLRLQKRIQADDDTSPMALAFSEGTLLKAVKEGQWILLDEINLAEPEVLQCLVLILDSIRKPHVYMIDCNEFDEPVTIHPNFRIFACMNPATDVGKRELAPGTRGRFTEFFVDDISDKQDLRTIVESYVKTCLTTAQIESIVTFYLEVRARTGVLSDISGNPPIYSLRTLCRALQICANNVCQNMEKSLFESLKITFLQQLNDVSILQVMKVLESTVFTRDVVAKLTNMKAPMPKDDHQYVEVEGFWIRKSNEEIRDNEKYVMTKSVQDNLRSLSRIISLSKRKLPILIQGNTSVGKTSLIMHLAQLTGNRCIRINNHEHTDLQEYVGRYVLGEDGTLSFQKGPLVRAMEKGYWIILDELNLAPCELLEALNRALDDNRELFIPETRQTIRAHSKFVLFATQNPPEEYAGRKILSRAFRNRFIELHFDEIPSDELETILQKRCEMAPQHAKKIVTTMKELQVFRRESGCFNGKNGFMTLRDLFRWGERYLQYKSTIPDKTFLDWDQQIASEGLILLEGRVRTVNEAETVKSIIERVFNRKLERDEIYTMPKLTSRDLPENLKHIFFSREFKKLYIQLSRALRFREPVLLCGQTGCGKTTACQLYAALNNQDLVTYNCHLNTESSDFIGSVRPCRSEDNDSKSGHQIFPWIDGPLLLAMRGAIFLLDEISLADDAVLERLNSVLEPTRSIVVTERDGREIFAHDRFRIVATMNPGGDYGKKELSPALRNRFTEIYCHNTTDVDQILQLVDASLAKPLLRPKVHPPLLYVVRNFLEEYYRGASVVSIRDILSWVHFINKSIMANQRRALSMQEAIINGAALVFFDQFGTGGHQATRQLASKQVKNRLKRELQKMVNLQFGFMPVHPEKIPCVMELNDDIVCFKKFSLRKGPLPISSHAMSDFIIEAPTVMSNLMKIVRAMQLDRPILLEGDPGTGKTSVVSALAKLTGHKLVRINLSEQTDISDLFGSDLPDTNSSTNDTPKFCWHDGPMLQAIRESSWILLDEMNLASQSVLEGLNACFDHRGEIYIPEIDKLIKVDRGTTRIFACQNPHSQGSARKGLPQSFVNRFTSICIESHTDQDLLVIIKRLYNSLPEILIEKMIMFNRGVCEITKYSGFEFNLRDLLYWCDLITRYAKCSQFSSLNLHQPENFVQFVYLDRIRMPNQRIELQRLHESIFERSIYEPPYREIRLGELSLIIGRSIIMRNRRDTTLLPQLCILKYQLPYLESIAKALEFKRMPIIVGDAGVGKRSMVRILAALTGNELNIVGANRDMDTVELLGSFEQKSLQREIIDLVEDSKEFVNSMINSISQKNIASSWSQLFKHIWSTLYTTFLRDLNLSRTELSGAYRSQLVQLKELMMKIKPLAPTCIHREFERIMSRVDRIRTKFLYDDDSMYSIGNFEWIDSVLIRSIRKGHWLLIENANLLNPATLDRLNSLVEPNGTLSLNEKGSGTNGIEILKLHPNFRLILTMSTEHGELSRAMRNRGAEVYVETRFFFEDFLMLLYQNGFEPEEKRPCMSYCIMETCVEAHKKITDEEAYESDSGSILAFFALNYVSRLTHQIRRGLDTDRVLADLLIAYYNQKGYIEGCNAETMHPFIKEKMTENRAKYEVNLHDDRYQWRHLIHDLVALTTGDAVTSMIHRDNNLFNLEPRLENYLKPDEMIENIDIVNTCLNVKIFLELSTHGDFEYRKGFIKETFTKCPNVMATVNDHVDLLHGEYIPQINGLLPRAEFVPAEDVYVDTRNSPDIHYYLLSNNYTETSNQELMQNRWLLSLHRIMLRMIIELVEERSMENQDHSSLWLISDKVRTNKMLKEDLIRPNAEICMDLYDLLDGLLRTVSNRLFDNKLVSKMLPKLFWIHYFICKLKKRHSKNELVAICNQLPMLWALTYQKVIVPLIQDCKLADIVYKNKKFSNRIKHICDFLEIPVMKPGKSEREYYNKVINNFAPSAKICDAFCREVDKLFATLLTKYSSRTPHLITDVVETHNEILSAASLIWSDSNYSTAFYLVEDKLIELEFADRNFDHARREVLVSEATEVVNRKLQDYAVHLKSYKESGSYRFECLNVNRRRNGLDQFAPIWQHMFVQTRLSQLDPSLADPTEFLKSFKRILGQFCGIIVSPRYYATVLRFILKLVDRECAIMDEDTSILASSKLTREDEDMYTMFLLDHLIENVVLDNQVVGWTKMRVTTCDLATQAPIIPEYSPNISLVASYCLDIAHLKLNSYESQSSQLSSFLSYLWRSYAITKLNQHANTHDINLAKKLLHLRQQSDSSASDTNVTCQCKDSDCACIDDYVKSRVPTFSSLMDTVKAHAAEGDCPIICKSIRLIYYGYLNYLEFAPIFSLDPALRTREKLDVYRAELAHIKSELHFKNTLYYWKTGENLSLNEDPENLQMLPFPMRLLVERRIKLEKSLAKLRQEHNKRPKSDDGALYYDLRKEIEITIQGLSNNIHSLMKVLVGYLTEQSSKSKSQKFTTLNSKCRMLIKNLEKSILHFRSKYSLYSDLTTNFLVGMCFAQQGLRCLYSRFEQKMQILELGCNSQSPEQFAADIMRVFSFNNFDSGSLDLVCKKLKFIPTLEKLCPPEEVNNVISLLLRTVLLQLNHYIAITPSDIQRCIPIVRNIADLFRAAWLKRKLYLEEQRRKKEEIYQYKVSRSALGNEISFERQEFLELCSKFPTYDHVFKEQLTMPSTDEENLNTEEKIANLNRSVDISMCIDICKAHYKFMVEASRNLMGQLDNIDRDSEPRKTDLSKTVRLEAEILYATMRQCILSLDKGFDAISYECHLLQAYNLGQVLEQPEINEKSPGDIKSSIEILDDDHFDIYHSANAFEALKLQEFICKLENRINLIRASANRIHDNQPLLHTIMKLTARIGSFLITDPLMKFVTGAHAILEKIEQWNQQKIPKHIKLVQEADDLVDLIKSWRQVEVRSWHTSLHKVKRRYIDNSLCDLWFSLYETFRDPIGQVTQFWQEKGYVPEGWQFTEEHEDTFYQGFAQLMQLFFEEATMGDFQIRLDLVFSFAIQTRFASLYEQTRSNVSMGSYCSAFKVDYEKLTTYVYNVFRQHDALFEPLKASLKREEGALAKELMTEVRIVQWQGRCLWDIKNNFRISHRKLNKVMNKYLEVLRRSITLLPEINKEELKDQTVKMTFADTLSRSLTRLHSTISQTTETISIDEDDPITSLSKVDKTIGKLKALANESSCSIKDRFVKNLDALEQSFLSSCDAVKNFHSHRVEDVVIEPKDNKEVRAEKHKLCRQMHHSKKFALQSIFKNLQTIGVSFQRGLNNSDGLDEKILALEPLRGMIKNQSSCVMNSTDKLVSDDSITACNALYKKMIANYTFLISRTADDLTSDQKMRIEGLAIDMVRDISILTRNAAIIYKYLVGVQASATRLMNLQQQFKSSSPIIFNFSKVHRVVKLFNDYVGRSLLAMTKLDEICACFEFINQSKPDSESTMSPVKTAADLPETSYLNDLINQIDEKNSLLTEQQYEHIKCHLSDSRKTITSVKDALRDMLNNTGRNHLYSFDDIDNLRHLYRAYINAFSRFIPISDGEEVPLNCQPSTLIGALAKLRDDARVKLEAGLKFETFESDAKSAIKLHEHPNLVKLNIRLHKLIRQVKLAAQDTYLDEKEYRRTTGSILSESAKRKLKPFNYIDSCKIRKSLRGAQVFKHANNTFITLNNELKPTDIGPIVSKLTPILSIYTQDVAGYLNIILQTLQAKLTTSIKLFTFFIDLKEDGFGLPIKAIEESTDGAKPTSKPSEDNTGFGDGQGDIDVSKKLEFESQLDDLRAKDGDDTNPDKETDVNIEAHDDGVEMSEDIDAEAKGPENGGSEDKENGNKENDEDDAEEDSNLNELDKEMDTVDDDEGHLDQNLWGEKDEDLASADDDEEDLRETDVDPTIDVNQDERELQAKDDQLNQSKSTVAREDQKSEQRGTQPPAEGDDDNDQNAEDASMNDAGDAAGDPKPDEDKEGNDHAEEDGLDLEDEAAQALKDVSEKDTEMKDELGADTNPEESIDMSPAEKSEGELSPRPSEKDISIDDDEIDDQLELAANNPQMDEQLKDPLGEEVFSKLPTNANDQIQGQEIKATQYGNHTCYEVIPEENDDPIDFDDKETPVQSQQQQQEDTSLAPDESVSERGKTGGSAQSKVGQTGGDSMELDTINEEKPEEISEEIDVDDSNVDEKGSQDKAAQKRTLAERDERAGDTSDPKKRQKILDNQDSEDKRKESCEKDASQLKTSGQVRHIEENTDAAIEVIDLCDSEDEMLEKEPELVDNSSSTKLKPKLEEKAKSDQASSREKGDSLESEIDITGDDSDKVNSPNEEQPAPEKEKDADLEPKPKDDIETPEEGEASLSSISSFAADALDDDDLELRASSFDMSTSYNTNLGLLKFISSNQEVDKENKSMTNGDSVLSKIDELLKSSRADKSGEHESLTADMLTKFWIECTRSTGHLVHELCQQLQIVLQPTKMSKYKGDYKSGKRLNMRKIISYIASHYRKDKIWLRRTKPSKRTYNICLAVDNSSSMSENNCRQMTYQSLALLARSLSLIEAGSLSVISFGQQVKSIHEFGQPYVDAIGAHWLHELRFNEPKTSYSQMLKFSCEAFDRQAKSTVSQLQTPTSVNQLLVIISDGRNVSHEEEEVKSQLRQLKSQGVLTLFIVIDDLSLNKGSSIVDTKRTIGFGSGGIKLVNYMELFPFPFYVLLRQLDSMPSVLGDALRQWFELVSASESTYAG